MQAIGTEVKSSLRDNKAAMGLARWSHTQSESFKKKPLPNRRQQDETTVLSNRPQVSKRYGGHLYKISYEAELRVLLNANRAVTLPYEYHSWAESIENSRYISGYVETDPETGLVTTYSEETWEEAVKVIADIATLAFAEGYVLPAPAIYDGDKGSIDIRWKTDALRLLVNIPPTINSISFYGDDIHGQFIKGTLHNIEDLKATLLPILKSVE